MVREKEKIEGKKGGERERGRGEEGERRKKSDVEVTYHGQALMVDCG